MIPTKTELNSAPSSSPHAPAPLWANVIATFFGAGKLRPGPGTWGSAAAVLIWYGLSRWIAIPWQWEALALLALLAIVVGIPAATRFARASQSKDPQSVVVDEVAGQWITLLAAPVTWKSLLVGFILFRGFDILKPPPVRQLESLPEGTGIVIDDVAAGLYALLVMTLLRHFGLLTQ